MHVHGPNESHSTTALPEQAHFASKYRQLCWSPCGSYIIIYFPSENHGNFLFFRHCPLTNTCSLLQVSDEFNSLDKKLFLAKQRLTLLPCFSDIFTFLQAQVMASENVIAFHCVYSNGSIVSVFAVVQDDIISSVESFPSKLKFKSPSVARLTSGQVISKCVWMPETKCLAVHTSNSRLDTSISIHRWCSLGSVSANNKPKYHWELIHTVELPTVGSVNNNVAVGEANSESSSLSSYVKNILPNSLSSVVFNNDADNIVPVTRLSFNPDER